jgi:hypothetical protein
LTPLLRQHRIAHQGKKQQHRDDEDERVAADAAIAARDGVGELAMDTAISRLIGAGAP